MRRESCTSWAAAIGAALVSCAPDARPGPASESPLPRCTVEALAAHARSVPDLAHGDRRSASAGLLLMAHMDQCAREFDTPVAGLELVHGRELAHVIDRFGWPATGAWTPDVEHAAFLLAQHAPDLGLQQRVLAELAPRVDRDPLAAQRHAYLHDRIQAVRLGQPQRYGTQGRCEGPGDWRPLPIEDVVEVAERRRRAGLPPLADYVAEMSQHCDR